MKLRAGFGLGTLFFMIASSASAYNSEPDGFRSLQWGASASSVPWLMAQATSKGDRLYDPTGMVRDPKNKNVPVTIFERGDEKLEFGGMELDNVSYVFVNDKFFAAFLNYHDMSFDPNRRNEQHGISTDLAKLSNVNLGAKDKVDAALNKYFGPPTTSPNAIFKIAFKAVKYTWAGERTRIESECSSSGFTCRVTFTSVELESEYLKARSNVVASKMRKDEDAAKKQREENQAKSDF